ncbi:MAG: hypothetical protein ACJ763_15925 [Bdellovibrionia bacterium]
MKKLIHVVGTALPMTLCLVMASSGCSTIKGGKSGSDLASNGPTVVQTKTDPSTIQLDTSLAANQPANVYADVKDFTSPVQDVRLRFIHVPLELKMHNLSGSTWQATIPADALKKLAVSGQTMRYQADVIARDADGRVATTQKPIDIAVKAPEPTELKG